MRDTTKSSPSHTARPARYNKPRYKIPHSVKSSQLKSKMKKRATFNVKTHGIHRSKPKYWFRCMVLPCNQTFRSIRLWNQHHAVIHKSKPLVCDICKKSFTKPSAKKSHNNSHASHRYSCIKCTKTFAYVSALRQHKLVHSRQRFKCFAGKCTHSYKYPWDLNRHVKTHLAKEYQCPDCPKTFKETRLLKRHSAKHSTIFKYVWVQNKVGLTFQTAHINLQSQLNGIL